jgi:serine/threonine-protein kinase
MPDRRRVLELVEQILDSEATPEEVCQNCPELLPQVRARLHRLRAVENDVGMLFPTPAETKVAPAGLSVADLPAVPGYELRDILGRGGVGVVYRAWQPRLQRAVALKMLLAGPFAQVHERERFLREVEAVAGLRHPNIVPLYDAGEADGRPYFTMELVEGGSLAQKIAGVPQPAAQAAALVAAVADAVQVAHQNGIIHRDLKPHNILLTSDGTPKVTDFGLARRLENGGALTVSGAVMGTPSYMAPEQARGKNDTVGPATDVYALGVVLYELLTGRPPFQAETPTATLQQVLADDPVPPRQLNRRVPRDLETICLKCLHKEPARRYHSAAALAEDLRRQAAGEPIRARPAGPVERGLRWLRQHPAQVRALTAVLVLLVVLIVLGFRWHELHQAAVHAAVVQAERDLKEAQHLQKLRDYQAAGEALQHAKEVLGEDGPAELHKRLAVATHNLKLVERLDTIRIERTLVLSTSMDQTMQFNTTLLDPDDPQIIQRSASPGLKYAAAFREAGLGTPGEDPAVVAQRAADSLVRGELVAALDDWSACASDVAQRAWVLDVVRRADPDPWRDQVRDPDNWKKPKVLADLADTAVVAEQPPPLLVVLAARLRSKKIDTRPFITRVALAHPTDFWVNLEAADTLHDSAPLEAMGYLRAALAIRPKVAMVHFHLFLLTYWQKRWSEAAEHLGNAIRLNPSEPYFRVWAGFTLSLSGRYDEAVAKFDEALKLAPKHFWAHYGRSRALDALGRLTEALDDCREALEAAPQFWDGKLKVPDGTDLREKLLSLYLRLNRGHELPALWRKQLAARPTAHETWFGYAELCLFLGDIKEYQSHREELFARFGGAKDPVVAERVGRACLLLPWSDEKQQQAAALIDIAMAAPLPKYEWERPYFLFAKGLAEYRQEHFQSAIELMEGPAGKVMGPAPRLVAAMAQYKSGQQQQARKTLAAAVLSFDWRPAKADSRDLWIVHILRREAETLIVPQWPGFLAGKYEPQDNDERMALLGICQFKDLRYKSAHLYAGIFAADPHLAGDLWTGHRYTAARAAAVAGCGGGADGAKLSDKDRAGWRQQALKWLRQDLDASAQLLKTASPQVRDVAQKVLAGWRAEIDLAGVREQKALDKLAPTERQEWLTFWEDHDALVKQIQTPK